METDIKSINHIKTSEETHGGKKELDKMRHANGAFFLYYTHNYTRQ